MPPDNVHTTFEIELAKYNERRAEEGKQVIPVQLSVDTVRHYAQLFRLGQYTPLGAACRAALQAAGIAE